MVMAQQLADSRAVVDYLAQRFLSVPLDTTAREALAEFLRDQLGTDDIAAAETYLEDPLRKLLHLILSRPEYQLG
jgi:hypothetical protein